MHDGIVNGTSIKLETAADRYVPFEGRMFTGFRGVFTIHHSGVSATGPIAVSRIIATLKLIG